MFLQLFEHETRPVLMNLNKHLCVIVILAYFKNTAKILKYYFLTLVLFKKMASP